MTSNSKRDWYSILNTNELREPPKSFEALQLLISDPTLKYKDVAFILDIPYNTLTKWAIKYNYRPRLQAYQEDITNALYTATVNHKVKLIESINKRLDSENKILSNDLTILAMCQEKIIKLNMNGEDVPPDLLKKYLKLRGSYFKDKLQHIKASKELHSIIYEPVEIEDTNPDELPPGARAFVNALRSRREKAQQEDKRKLAEADKNSNDTEVMENE